MLPSSSTHGNSIYLAVGTWWLAGYKAQVPGTRVQGIGRATHKITRRDIRAYSTRLHSSISVGRARGTETQPEKNNLDRTAAIGDHMRLAALGTDGHDHERARAIAIAPITRGSAACPIGAHCGPLVAPRTRSRPVGLEADIGYFHPLQQSRQIGCNQRGCILRSRTDPAWLGHAQECEVGFRWRALHRSDILSTQVYHHRGTTTRARSRSGPP